MPLKRPQIDEPGKGIMEVYTRSIVGLLVYDTRCLKTQQLKDEYKKFTYLQGRIQNL